MFDIGWSELLLITLVALLVLDAEDVPVMMGKLGRCLAFVRKTTQPLQHMLNAATMQEEARALERQIQQPLEKNAPLPVVAVVKTSEENKTFINS